MSMTIDSSAFSDGQAIPRKHAYKGEGNNLSPALSWSGLPAGAKELALIVDDSDAPAGDWVHWVMYKISPGAGGLKEGLAVKDKLDEPAGALQGKNSFIEIGYGGPIPPRGHGTHHYHFKLYALDTQLNARPGLDKAALLKLMQGHVLAQTETVGTYQRK